MRRSIVTPGAPVPRWAALLLIADLAVAGPAAAAPGQAQPARVDNVQDSTPLTLQSALAQARVNSQQFRAAQAASQLAAEDRKQALGALLPSLSEFSQYIYTQPNGTPSGVFVANDGVNVYNTWLTVHGDLFSPGKWAEYKSAAAAEAVARAKADVAIRGLVATVVQNYYGLVAANRKAASARQGLQEAQQFLVITQRQEAGGEVAHSDVVKAQIQQQQRQRDAQDAELAALKARLALSVLVFPDFRDAFAVVDDLQDVAALPPLDDVKAKATGASPDLKAAEATVQQQQSDVGVARGGILPSVSVDYFYGINANQWATTNPDGNRLLGSVVQAQLTVPLWSWGATQSKVRQAQLRVQQAKADLTLTQRQLLANVSTFYGEAQVARDQVATLRTSLDLSTESLRLTLLRYQAGEVSVLEVVDAQTTLIQARNAYDDGLVRYRVALAALQTLTGTL
ncbi:MAG: TolC family protein [Acidobacteriia bacterium]|nr:TolC family protein [Terriglobia bacterium]